MKDPVRASRTVPQCPREQLGSGDGLGENLGPRPSIRGAHVRPHDLVEDPALGVPMSWTRVYRAEDNLDRRTQPAPSLSVAQVGGTLCTHTDPGGST